MRKYLIIFIITGLFACNHQKKNDETSKNNDQTQKSEIIEDTKELVNEPNSSFVEFLELFGKNNGKISKEFSEKYLDSSEFHLPKQILLNDTLIICEITNELSVGLVLLTLYTENGERIDVENVGCEGDCDTKIDLIKTERDLRINVRHSAYDPTDETDSEWVDVYEVTVLGIKLIEVK